MLLIPAIDLQDGRCVRLRQGDLSDATFPKTPSRLPPTGSRKARSACTWLI